MTKSHVNLARSRLLCKRRPRSNRDALRSSIICASLDTDAACHTIVVGPGQKILDSSRRISCARTPEDQEPALTISFDGPNLIRELCPDLSCPGRFCAVCRLN